MINPKITLKEISLLTGLSKQTIQKKIQTKQVKFRKDKHKITIDHYGAREILEVDIKSKIISVQIVKGGTGKSTLTNTIAFRASLLGLRVLCVDLDQQANLTVLFGAKDIKNKVVLHDLIKNNEEHNITKYLINVAPGIDLLASGLNNAALDDIILIKGLSLDRVYKEILTPLKNTYDLILIDCPPALGRSVGAATLASDFVVAPVIPDKLCLHGLELLEDSIEQLANSRHGRRVPYKIVFNKHDNRVLLTPDILKELLSNEKYSKKLLNSYIRHSQELPNSSRIKPSLYENLKTVPVKEDIDLLTRELLGIPGKIKLRK